MTTLAIDQTLQLRDKYGFPPDVTFETLERKLKTREQETCRRENWPPGPWDTEPFDKVVWTDPNTNYLCMLVRGPMGSWCGYVGIPKTHPWFGVDYGGCTKGHKLLSKKEVLHKYRRSRERSKSRSERDMWNNLISMTLNWHAPEPICGRYSNHSPANYVDVHGGLTYSDSCKGTICHPHKDSEGPVWWFGFDTAHFMDVVPGMLASSKAMYELGHSIFTDHLDYDENTGALVKYGDMQTYKDVNYCRKHVIVLAAQLHDHAKPVPESQE